MSRQINDEDDVVVVNTGEMGGADGLWESTESPMASPPRPPADREARMLRSRRERTKLHIQRIWTAMFALQDDLDALDIRKCLLRRKRQVHLMALRSMLEQGAQFVSTADALQAAEHALCQLERRAA